jgi:hypothetical protein
VIAAGGAASALAWLIANFNEFANTATLLANAGAMNTATTILSQDVFKAAVGTAQAASGGNPLILAGGIALTCGAALWYAMSNSIKTPSSTTKSPPASDYVGAFSSILTQDVATKSWFEGYIQFFDFSKLGGVYSNVGQTTAPLLVNNQYEVSKSMGITKSEYTYNLNGFYEDLYLGKNGEFNPNKQGLYSPDKNKIYINTMCSIQEESANREQSIKSAQFHEANHWTSLKASTDPFELARNKGYIEYFKSVKGKKLEDVLETPKGQQVANLEEDLNDLRSYKLTDDFVGNYVKPSSLPQTSIDELYKKHQKLFNDLGMTKTEATDFIKTSSTPEVNTLNTWMYRLDELSPYIVIVASAANNAMNYLDGKYTLDQAAERTLGESTEGLAVLQLARLSPAVGLAIVAPPAVNEMTCQQTGLGNIEIVAQDTPCVKTASA